MHVCGGQKTTRDVTPWAKSIIFIVLRQGFKTLESTKQLIGLPSELQGPMSILSQYTGLISVCQNTWILVVLFCFVFLTSLLGLKLNSCLTGKPCSKGAVLASAQIPSPHIPRPTQDWPK